MAGVAVAIVFGLSITACSTAPEDTTTSQVSTQQESGAAVSDDLIYLPVPGESEMQDELSQLALADAEDIENLERALVFSLLVPKETFGMELYIPPMPGSEEPRPENIAVLFYSDDGGAEIDMQITEEQAPTVAEAQERVDQIAFGAVTDGFDDRFMQKVEVRGGHEGVAWNADSVPSETDKDGTFRPEIKVGSSGLVWIEGTRVYHVAGGKTLDIDQLLKVADSMK